MSTIMRLVWGLGLLLFGAIVADYASTISSVPNASAPQVAALAAGKCVYLVGLYAAIRAFQFVVAPEKNSDDYQAE